MVNKDELIQIFSNDYPGWESFLNKVLVPVFGDDIKLIEEDLAEDSRYAGYAAEAGLSSVRYYGILSEKEARSQDISLFDVTIKDSVRIERSRVGIQRLIRSIVGEDQHILMTFHYRDVKDQQWRLSYAYRDKTLAASTPPKRYTYVFGKGYRGRTAAERFDKLSDSPRHDTDFIDAFSVEILSKEFFDKYRKHYADFVEYITGKRYDKVKGKWVELETKDPEEEIFAQFKHDDKRVRDYIKKMMGRLTFLYFVQRKGWLNHDYNFINNLFADSPHKDDYLDAVLEPLFFGVLNTRPENRHEVFVKNGWNTDLIDQWKEIPYLNGGLFEQTDDDRFAVRFKQEMFDALFRFFGQYNFTIDENDPYDAEVGIDPEMLGRVFESLLEDNKDKGAFYTPKEIVQYMCQQSIIQYLKTHTADESLYPDIEKLINEGLVSETLQNPTETERLTKLLSDVKVCDPAIGSGAFPMGILDILYSTRHRLYGSLKTSKPFNPLEIKMSIIRNNIYGVDIDQGAVDIARLRFWLAILVEETHAMPLPNLDYRIVRGNSLLTTFNDQYIDLSYTTDKRTKLVRLKKELYSLQDKLYSLNGDEKLKCELDIKLKLLDIIEYQLDKDTDEAIAESTDKSGIFDRKKISARELKKIAKAEAVKEKKYESLQSFRELNTILTHPDKTLIEKAQTDINFFDWDIIFSDVFTNGGGFDIVIGNPPYISALESKKIISESIRGYYKKIYASACGAYDLYVIFFEKGLTLLKDNGVLSYITPSKYLSAEYAHALRQLLICSANVKQLIDFSDIRVFASAGVSTMITLLTREEQGDFISCKRYETLTKPRLVYVHPKEYLTWLPDNIWGALLTESVGILSSIISRCERLTKYAQVNACSTAGESEIYENSLTENSVDAFRYINNGTFTRFTSFWGSKPLRKNKMLKPYLPWSDEVMSDRRRNLFNKPKLIFAKIGRYPQVFYDRDGVYASANTNMVYDVKGYDMYALCAFFNSKLFNYMYRTMFGGLAMLGSIQIQAPQIRKLYIPNRSIIPASLISLSKSVCDTKATDPDADTADIEKRIDIIIYKMFRISYDDIILIDNEFTLSEESYNAIELN